MKPRVEAFESQASLLQAALAQFREVITSDARTHVVCLSGGNTPRPFYDLLSSEARAGRLNLAQVEWMLGDERIVPVSHARSNFRMIREHLFEPAGISAERIHPMAVMLPDRRAAVSSYESLLQLLHGAPTLDAARPLFDFVLLGLGEDGHIASLFPGACSLDERERWVAATRAPDGEPRLSLTLPVLASARRVVCLVEGAGKRDALARWRANDTRLPAARLEVPAGILVLADEAAARG